MSARKTRDRAKAPRRRARRTAPARSARAEGRDRRLRLVAGALIALVTLGVLIAAGIGRNQVRATDVFIYHCYAQGFWQGTHTIFATPDRSCAPLWSVVSAPFHAFPAEYPAPALAVFSLPLLTPFLTYDTAYIIWMALCLFLATAALAWRGRLQEAVALPLYVLLAGWGFALQRYDLVVGLGIAAAILMAHRGRPVAAAAFLAIATLLKGLPVVLLPLLLVPYPLPAGTRRWLEVLGAFAGVCAIGLLPAALLDPASIWKPIAFQLTRPLQIESLPGSLLWITSNAGLGPAPHTPGGPYAAFTYNSLNVAGGGQLLFGTAALLAGAVGILAGYWRAWRGHDSQARSAILILIVLIVTAKVFSPQYLLWLLPAAALAEGIRLRWLLVAALTWVIVNDYGTMATVSLPWNAQFMATIVARDLSLCALALLYLGVPGDRLSAGWPNVPAWRRWWPAPAAPARGRA